MVHGRTLPEKCTCCKLHEVIHWGDGTVPELVYDEHLCGDRLNPMRNISMAKELHNGHKYYCDAVTCECNRIV